MHIGSYISGAGHIGLLGWLFFGGPPPAPVVLEVQSVSTISTAEFEALLAGQTAPEGPIQVAQPPLPDVENTPLEVLTEPDPAVADTPPEVAPPPPEEEAPPVVEITPPPPIEEPSDPSDPVGAVAVPVPEVGPEAVPAPSERVAPDPVAQPDPDAQTDPVEQEAVSPDAEGETVQDDAQTATAPEAAATEIVPETTQAPQVSLRPPGRRPAPPTRSAAAPPPAEDEVEQAVNDVMRTLTAEQNNTAAPSGPPLSSGEKEALRVAVSACWNVGSLSSEALRTTVVLGVSMNQDGTPILGSIRLISSADGSQAAARQAYEAARRAIIRCGARGYDLPQDKYDQWQDIEMTFNPERMRVR